MARRESTFALKEPTGGNFCVIYSDLFLEVEELIERRGQDELSADALHPSDDGLNVIRSGTINVGRNADVLLWRSDVEG